MLYWPPCAHCVTGLITGASEEKPLRASWCARHVHPHLAPATSTVCRNVGSVLEERGSTHSRCGSYDSKALYHNCHSRAVVVPDPTREGMPPDRILCSARTCRVHMSVCRRVKPQISYRSLTRDARRTAASVHTVRALQHASGEGRRGCQKPSQR